MAYVGVTTSVTTTGLGLPAGPGGPTGPGGPGGPTAPPVIIISFPAPPFIEFTG